MKRLFIVDPSLKDIRGHHYMMTREATRSAQQLGFDVVWLCSEGFSGALDAEKATVAPVFRSSMYDAYISQQQQAKKPDLLTRLKRKLTGRRDAPPPAPMGGFFEDLQSAMAQWEIGPEDRILLHTADGESLPAVARIIRETPLEALPVFHVATPYDPVGVMPKRQVMEGFEQTLEQLKEAGALGRKLFLYAENAYLAEHLSQLWPATVRPLPIPASAPEANACDAARTRLCEKLRLQPDSFLIVSLGSARLEKGFQHIPDIVAHVFERATGDIRFILHASPQIVGRDPKITEAINRLQARPEGQAHLLLEPLSDDDYQDLLLASDVVLLPYGEHEYRVRGSAVVTEALAAGKTIVATANTYPGKAAHTHGGLTADTPASFADAILEVYGARAAFSARAKNERENFVAANSMESYWRRCLDAEREENSSSG
ncbi:glycosyltransferase [Marinicaulis aureus]|uniref:Glycosyltransferase n=1 Tax=Hyphococcus aureus TaxID=2666033 RepID=A0ABW1KXC5_9PROT